MIFTLLVAAVALALVFGGELLVAPDPLPDHADVAVALTGSATSSKARADEAIRLVQEGRVEYALLAISPNDHLWRWPRSRVDEYFKTEYGEDTGSRILACMINRNSTWEEAVALGICMEYLVKDSIIIVTSNFHTRRAKLVWNEMFAISTSPPALAVWGVDDGRFEVQGWWRRRLYAKTWLVESASLAWYLLGSTLGLHTRAREA